MDMQAKKGPADGAGMRGEISKVLSREPVILAQWCVLADIARWGISTERFTEELARCVEAKFRVQQPSAAELNAYVGALRLEDLGLAFFCPGGGAGAWGRVGGVCRGCL